MKKAVFITNPTMNPIEYNHKNPIEEGILTFRRKFACEKEVKRAVLRATALGIFDMELNGRRVRRKSDGGMVYD